MQSDSRNRKNLKLMVDALDYLRRLDSEMPIQYAVSFLNIALHEDKEEGLAVQDLESLVGLSQSATSRNVQALSKWFKPKVPGHDLVESFENPMDRRKKIVRLTQKGQHMISGISKLLGSINHGVL